MNSHDPTQAHAETPWPRDRLHRRIEEGITEAQDQHREIDDATAHRIARALGQAVGAESALATFGETGEGSYEALREEYLDLYTNESTPPEVRRWIDWLGTHLVSQRGGGSGRRFMNEHLPPRLEQLAPTTVTVGGQPFTVYVPGDQRQAAIDELAGTLTELMLDQDPALQAFLTLPDVNALSGDIMEHFHENYVSTYARLDDAIDELVEVDELEREVQDFANDRGLYVDSITPDYEQLIDRARESYDLVEWQGKVYAFYK